MSQYQIRIAEKALADMTAIYEYIAENIQAPDTALKQYDRIADGIESLNEFRNRCPQGTYPQQQHPPGQYPP